MNVLDIFKSFANIPRCSGNTQKMRDFIVEWAKRYGYGVDVDAAGNLLVFKGKGDVVLQSHYDMVCVGRAPDIQIIEENGYLGAQNSTLGADNGIGVAIMLKLISEGIEARYLFTNDEEIGLVGAKNLAFRLDAKKMINLDSEEFGNIYIGCAGGVDFEAKKRLYYQGEPKEVYEVELSFGGGHSGVDIDKDIPNAIKELAFLLSGKSVAHFEGGERINSIPANAKALLFEKIAGARKSDEKKRAFKTDIIKPLLAFANGVRGWNKEFDIPQDSINLSIVKTDNSEFRVEVGARSMSQEGLKRLIVESEAFFEGFGFDVKTYGYYPPWEPKISPFAKEVEKAYKKIYPDTGFKAIHAGLECAIFAQKYPDMQIVSIGPDIEYPHSTKERVKISTVEPLYRMVKELLC